MSVSNYTEAAWLSRIKNAATTAATTHHYSFHSADPADTGANEITLTHLASRASYTATGYAAPSTSSSFRVSKNSASISYGNAIAASPTGGVAYYGCWDAAINGNFLYGGLFQNALGTAQPLQFGNGDPVAIAINALSRLVPINPLSIFEADKILGFLTSVNLPAMATMYAGLNTSISPDGTGGESTVTVRAAGRVAVAASAWSAISTFGVSQQISSLNNLDFGSSAGAVTGLTALTFWDAATLGNLIGYGLRTSINIATGEPVLVPASSIIWRIS